MKRGLHPANDRARWIRPRRRAILAATTLALAIAAVPASAGAVVRTGSVQDPQGDAPSFAAPVPDIKSVAVRYDDMLGSVGVTWTYYNDIRADYPQNSFGARGSFSAAGYGLPIDQFFVGWTGTKNYDGSWSFQSDLSVVGVGGTLSGTPTVSANGQVVAAEFTNTMLAGHDWKQGLGDTGGGSGDPYDGFWFDGYSAPTPTYPPVGSPPPGTTPPGNGGGAAANQGMTINGEAQYTNDPDVTLSVIAPSGVVSLRVANDGGFRAAKTFPVRTTIHWHLAESGPERLPKTVYLRFGNDAQTFTDDIILDQTRPTVSSATAGGSAVASTRAAVAQAAASHSKTYRVRIDAKDATSGVAKVQFAERSKRHPSALRTFERITRFKGTHAPKYVRVQDRAGNYSGWRSVR